MSDIAFPEYTKDCPEGMLQKTIKVSDMQTDASGRMRVSELARQMEKITEEHLSVFGMSRKELYAEGKIWVIAWNAIHIRRLPMQGETIWLCIWPCKMKSMMHSRKYAFYSLEGEPLACASSLFLLMDSETRSFSEPADRLKSVPVVVVPGEPELPKIRMAFPKTLSECVERVVQPEEIDKNGHLNNTHYLDWAESLHKSSDLEKHVPRSIWVQYSKELKKGQKVILRYEQKEDTLFVRGYSEENDSFLLSSSLM